ncbi:hypothetical protein SDC9_74064 [bioreactor metagenome]|uniref:Uncharacterized protein n=1 Tax=bioreactor metagenome TaxID=1076179 RepID=A0A644YG19_9ZZZZ
MDPSSLPCSPAGRERVGTIRSPATLVRSPRSSRLVDAAADELPQQRVERDLRAVQRVEEGQQVEQPVAGVAERAVVADPVQGRLAGQPQRVQFVDHAGVEHHVGVLLEAEDVAVLPAADAGPLFQGLLGARPAGPVVADDPAEQADLGGGHPVEQIDVQPAQGADVDLVELIAVDPAHQGRVEGVDALDHQDLAGADLDGGPLGGPGPGDEVEMWHLDRLPLDEPAQVVAQQGQVKGLRDVEVGPPVGVQRGPVVVEVVVVEGQADRAEPVHEQLGVEPAQERGLARRGGARDQQRAQGSVLGEDRVGDPGDLLLVQGLGDPDQFQLAPRPDEIVDVRHHFDAHPGQPQSPLGVRRLQLDRRDQRGVGTLADVAEVDDEAVRERREGERLDLRGPGQRRVERTDHQAVDVVHVVAVLAPDQRDRFVAGHPRAQALVDPADLPGGQVRVDQMAEDPLEDRVRRLQPFLGEQVVHHPDQAQLHGLAPLVQMCLPDLRHGPPFRGADRNEAPTRRA